MMAHMDITPYVETLRRDLLSAAEAAGPEARESAEQLRYALDPAVRLAIMEAVSQAAAEISTKLPAGSVAVHLQGRDLEFGVTLTTPQAPVSPTQPASPAETTQSEEEAADSGNLARITLRLPESLKTRAESAAAEAGQSLNTWLVAAVRAATRKPTSGIDAGLDAIPQIVNDAMHAAFEPGRTPGHPSRRMTGWL